MARIVHIALKVDDLEKATEFYEKGFGFVEMQDGADKAIAAMNGKDFKGRALTVNEAKPMVKRDFGGGGSRGGGGGRRDRY